MEATPRTNRSAKGGARSSLHYGGEGVLIHPPHQGVCGRHGTEDLGVTPGGLSGSSGGTEGSDPISASEVGSGVLGVVGRPNSTRSAVKVLRGKQDEKTPIQIAALQRDPRHARSASARYPG